MLQNQKYQQQPVIPIIKEIKDKLNDLENRSCRDNLRINGIIEEQNGLWSHSEKKLQEIIKNQLQFERDIEIECAHCSRKTMIDGAPNKNRTVIAKFLNFKNIQEVLSEYKVQKLLTKAIFLEEYFFEDTIEKRKGLFQRAKELREEERFVKVVYDRLIICDRRPGLENAEEGDSNV